MLRKLRRTKEDRLRVCSNNCVVKCGLCDMLSASIINVLMDKQVDASFLQREFALTITDRVFLYLIMDHRFLDRLSSSGVRAADQ